MNSPQLSIEKSVVDLNAFKAELLSLSTLSLSESDLKLPNHAQTFSNVKFLRLVDQPLYNVHSRFPNLEQLVSSEPYSKGSVLGLGQATSKFERMRVVEIDKTHTWTSLDLILDRITQFSNAIDVTLKYRVFHDTLANIKVVVPYDVYELERVKRKNHNYKQGVIFIEYRRANTVATLKVKKYS